MTEVDIYSDQNGERFRNRRAKAVLDLCRARPDAVAGVAGGLSAGGNVLSSMWHNPAVLDIVVNTTAATAGTTGLVGFLSLLLLSRRSPDGMYGEMRRRDQRAREVREGLRRR